MIRVPYLGIVLLVCVSLVFNVYISLQFFKLPETIEMFYQKDFVEVRVVCEQLVRDMEKAYGKEFPQVELNIRLSEYSKTGIKYEKYNGKILQLFLPPQITSLDSNQKRAYLAHEFGHYVLGHVDYQNYSIYSFSEARDLDKEIQADSFALRFSSPAILSSVIKKLVWEENEKRMRLFAVGIDP